jgi:Putative DNA-binding domain
MFDLFGTSWSDLTAEDVEAFLREADKEGITWEAKADHERSPLKPESIRKAACGLANQIGGYLILGARESAEGGWELSGIARPADEPQVWIGKILRGLQPVPRFEVKDWPLADGKFAAVVQIEPVADPPCMTPQGRVYERVTSETLPVEDPILLDKLFRRGQEARDRVARWAPEAADRALAASGWRLQKSVGFAVGLAPLGRETEDIASRLFTKDTRNAIREATWNLLSILRPSGHPEVIDDRQRQDFHAAALAFKEHKTFGVKNEVVATTQSTWLTQANWNGTVAASLSLSDGDVANGPSPEHIIGALWRVIVPLCQKLGGYGPSQLSVIVEVTRHRPGYRVRTPPEDTLYARLPEEQTHMGRVVDLAEPNDEVLASITREVRRAAGEIQDED